MMALCGLKSDPIAIRFMSSFTTHTKLIKLKKIGIGYRLNAQINFRYPRVKGINPYFIKFQYKTSRK